VLALKDNQRSLAEDVRDSFALAQMNEEHISVTTETEKRHGRVTQRTATVLSDPSVLAWIQATHHWPGLVAVGQVVSNRRVGEQVLCETRFFLLSRILSPTELAHAVRSHWGIENQVHWVLDVTFHEDASRIRAGHAAQNLAVLRHIALNLLRKEPSKRSLKGKRLLSALDTAFLLRVLLHF